VEIKGNYNPFKDDQLKSVFSAFFKIFVSLFRKTRWWNLNQIGQALKVRRNSDFFFVFIFIFILKYIMENNKKEFIERVKLITNYDLKKTLNENKEIIFEQNTVNTDEYIRSFDRATLGAGTNIKGIISVINLIKDKASFINFYNTLKTKKGKTFDQIINSEFESDNHKEISEISKLLKTKFGVDSTPGVKYYDRTRGSWKSLVSGNEYDKVIDMNPQFEKKFKITNFNASSTPVAPDPNKKDGYNEYMSTVDGPKTPAPPTPAPTAAPQSFNDVINGKGLLKFNMRSPAVGELQQKLISLGYTIIGTPTNYFGKNTQTAVDYFQNNNGLEKDRVVGPETSKKIEELLRSQQIATQRQQANAGTIPTAPRPTLQNMGNIQR
jgi:hypothetical protein